MADAQATQPSPSDAPPPPRRTLKARMVRLAKRVAVIYVVFLGAAFLGQRWLIFPDWVSPEPSADEKYDNSTMVLSRDIGDGEKVIAWYIPSPAARKGTPGPLVMYFHGNAEIIDSQTFPIEMYRNMGCSVLLPEYRGYGRSHGQPSQSILIEDAAYFLNEALKRPEVDRSRIVFHGRSLGSSVATHLAARHKPNVLILGSAFTSIRPFATRMLLPSFLITSPFDTEKVLPTLDLPVLIQHGGDDDIVPVEHGRKLKTLAKNCTYIEYHCRHNDFPGDGNEEQYMKDVQQFLEAHGIVQP